MDLLGIGESDAGSECPPMRPARAPEPWEKTAALASGLGHGPLGFRISLDTEFPGIQRSAYEVVRVGYAKSQSLRGVGLGCMKRP